MLAVRSAILVLTMGFLASPVAASHSSCGSSVAEGDAVVAACDLDQSDSMPVLDLLPDTSAFSGLARRTGRLKATLEESDHEFEEADLGPVHAPRGHNPPASVHFTSPPIPAICRLRC
jgi:hypothetical protein